MLDAETKRRIDTARDILVGKVPDPKSQVEQVTIALIYKFMDDMDAESEELGGRRKFFAGEFARYGWAKLMRSGLGGHEALSLYAEAIARMPENPGIPPLFRDIFKNAFLPYRDPETLRAFLKVIDEFHYDHSERLGDAFEYLLSVLGSQGEAGQFRTPRHIIDFIVEIIDPKKTETVIDPACGTAGFLISAWKHILRANSSPEEVGAKPADPNGKAALDSSRIPPARGDLLTPDERGRLAAGIRGYDISPDMVRLSLVNLYLHGFTNPHIHEYDTLTSQDRWNEHADVILANPPFMSPKGGIRPHNRFSVQSKRSEVLFVDYIAEHLTPAGRAGIIVPEGIIFQGQTAYKKLRRMLVEEYLVAVISLPAGVFQPYAGVKTSILVLDRALARRTDRIAFLKVENDGFGLGAQRRPIDKNDLPEVSALLRQWMGNCGLRKDDGGLLIADRGLKNQQSQTSNPQSQISSPQSSINNHQSSIPGPRCLLVPKEKIAANVEYNLSGERYRIPILKQYSWPKASIDELFEFVGKGKRPASFASENGQVPFFVSSLEVKRCNSADHDMEALIIGDGGTANIHYTDRPFSASDHTYILVPEKTKQILLRYAYECVLGNMQLLESGFQGQGIKNLSKRHIKSIQIPLPPLEIQKEIVAEIEGYRKVIDGARAVIDNYRPHIPIRPDWPMVGLGEDNLFNVESGGTPKSDAAECWGGNIAWATLVDLPQTDFVSEILRTKRTITERGLKESSAKLLPVNSIIVSTRATIGRIGINRIPLATNQGFKNVVIKNNSRAITEFVAYALTNCVAQMQAWATGGTFKELSKSKFCELQIPLPPMATQRAIVAEIEAEQALVAANRDLIARMEKKIQAVLARVWGEETPGAEKP